MRIAHIVILQNNLIRIIFTYIYAIFFNDFFKICWLFNLELFNL